MNMKSTSRGGGNQVPFQKEKQNRSAAANSRETVRILDLRGAKRKECEEGSKGATNQG